MFQWIGAQFYIILALYLLFICNEFLSDFVFQCAMSEEFQLSSWQIVEDNGSLKVIFIEIKYLLTVYAPTLKCHFLSAGHPVILDAVSSIHHAIWA